MGFNLVFKELSEVMIDPEGENKALSDFYSDKTSQNRWR